MESVFENQDEDREYQERRARRKARWVAEQKRRRKRKRMLRCGIVLGTGILLLLLIVMSVTTLFKKFGKEEESQQEAQTQTEQQEALMESGQQERVDVPEGPVEIENEEPEKQTPVYEFKEASDMVGIYSEEVISSHAILIDESADEIVAAKGAYDRISPASMTKVLTVLVAAEQITEEQLDNTFTMTREITDYAYVNDCSAVNFLDGEMVTVRDLFYGTVLPSGADAALGLAIYVAGSHEAFMDMMNA